MTRNSLNSGILIVCFWFRFSSIMIHSTLQHYFGFNQLRQGQEAVIQRILDGHSAAAIFPTGSGKSLCYQLPALLLPNLTLVISPLLALMDDQLAFLHAHNIPAESINSTQTKEETQRIYADIKNGKVKILMVSVERLNNERFRHFLKQIPLSLLVIDEAHCLSEWGHNFRPDYLKLPKYQTLFNIPQVLLLTATATPKVIQDMSEKFGIPSENVITTGFYRSNLDLTILPAEESQKDAILIAQCKADPSLPTIVYVTLQKTAETVANRLQAQGINAKAYHAGLDATLRKDLQQRFMNGEIQCMVATIAFGMGIDKSNIRRVIHFDLPKSIEGYSQEIGRAGRDGLPSYCSVIGNQNGLTVLENFIYGDTPDKQNLIAVLEDLQAHSQQWEILPTRLASDCNLRALPFKTLLVYLELRGLIQSQYAYYAEYCFKCLIPDENIVAQFQGERQQFVQQLFDYAPKAKIWRTLDFDGLYQRHHIDRQRVMAALEYFQEKNWIELETKQLTEVYRIEQPNFSIEQEAEALFTLFKDKECSEIHRIHAMINLFESPQCLSHQLAQYFSDQNAPKHCGHCSVCRGHQALLPKAETSIAFDTMPLTTWCQAFILACPTKPSAEALTRFLLGISNPLHTHIKARQLAGFGQLEQVPFQTVRDWVQRTVLKI